MCWSLIISRLVAFFLLKGYRRNCRTGCETPHPVCRCPLLRFFKIIPWATHKGWEASEQLRWSIGLPTGKGPKHSANKTFLWWQECGAVVTFSGWMKQFEAMVQRMPSAAKNWVCSFKTFSALSQNPADNNCLESMQAPQKLSLLNVIACTCPCGFSCFY